MTIPPKEGEGIKTQDFYRSTTTLLPTAIYYKCFSIPAPNIMCQAEKETTHCEVLLCLLLVASSGPANPSILSPNRTLQHRGNCLLLSGGMAKSPHTRSYCFLGVQMEERRGTAAVFQAHTDSPTSQAAEGVGMTWGPLCGVFFFF